MRISLRSSPSAVKLPWFPRVEPKLPPGTLPASIHGPRIRKSCTIDMTHDRSYCTFMLRLHTQELYIPTARACMKANITHTAVCYIINTAIVYASDASVNHTVIFVTPRLRTVVITTIFHCMPEQIVFQSVYWVRRIVVYSRVRLNEISKELPSGRV